MVTNKIFFCWLFHSFISLGHWASQANHSNMYFSFEKAKRILVTKPANQDPVEQGESEDEIEVNAPSKKDEYKKKFRPFFDQLYDKLTKKNKDETIGGTPNNRRIAYGVNAGAGKPGTGGNRRFVQ